MDMVVNEIMTNGQQFKLRSRTTLVSLLCNKQQPKNTYYTGVKWSFHNSHQQQQQQPTATIVYYKNVLCACTHLVCQPIFKLILHQDPSIVQYHRQSIDRGMYVWTTNTRSSYECGWWWCSRTQKNINSMQNNMTRERVLLLDRCSHKLCLTYITHGKISWNGNTSYK